MKKKLFTCLFCLILDFILLVSDSYELNQPNDNGETGGGGFAGSFAWYEESRIGLKVRLGRFICKKIK